VSLNSRAAAVLENLERASSLDRLADVAARALRVAVRPGPVEDALSGTPLGHPAHPAVVAVPIGAWVTTNVLDLVDPSSETTSIVQGVGILAALPAAATGASDWLSTAGPERRVGLIHSAANYAGLSLHVASWVARRHGRANKARLLGLAGTSVVAFAGWLGGHLAYALGVGVDTTAFQQYPTDWVDAVAEADVPMDGAIRAEVAGVPMLFARSGGQVVVYADRCTHRGAPLDEGSVADGCVTCPWHGSVFDLRDGSVVSGPATRPQPKMEVDVQNGRIRVRRPEIRTLRSNPVGR
jgi:nitrite reductase/ring-hydroxylating ferredoxin subunit/uncharacterized membrane protein